jgi:hypothetical protein
MLKLGFLLDGWPICATERYQCARLCSIFNMSSWSKFHDIWILGQLDSLKLKHNWSHWFKIHYVESCNLLVVATLEVNIIFICKQHII